MRSLLMFFSLWLFPAALLAADEQSNSPGLLFYLSGDHGFRADYSAGGKPEPNFLKDVKIVNGSRMTVTVHSLGSVDAPPARIVLRGGRRKVLATGRAPALNAPLDLYPKTATVSLTLPAGIDWKGGSVTIEPGGQCS
jgi:hypothetical protein